MPGAVLPARGRTGRLTRTRRLVLLDIEGTVGPVSFVHDVLFPYAHERMHEFLAARAGDPDVAQAVTALRDRHAEDARRDPTVPPWTGDEIAAAAAYARWLIEHDVKATPLKVLQGRIWEAAYRSGALCSELFDDVLPAFEKWRAAGIDIAIFSSGSVLAQWLYFAHTTRGDLRPFIRAYFDTTTGPKTDPLSYRAIAAALELPPGKMLFVTDVDAEAEAARTAGLTAAVRAAPGAEGGDPERVPDLLVLTVR